jgi:hypothetical protein
MLRKCAGKRLGKLPKRIPRKTPRTFPGKARWLNTEG